MRQVALSFLAHADDQELLSAGTLIRLKDAGWEIHPATVTPGDCGTMDRNRWDISAVRTQEAAAAAKIIGATYHCLDERDGLVVYDKPSIQKTVDLFRRVTPSLVFTHAPRDYMLDHEQASMLARELLEDAAKLTQKPLIKLPRPGFQIHYYETLEDFYLAEALEYVEAWRRATPDNPAGICGPIGPTEQLPLVARIVNALGLKLHDAHFWGMDEWVENGEPVSADHPLSFAKADMEMCFARIDKKLVMPKQNIHFPTGDLAAYSKSYDAVRCVVMQG